MGRRRKDALPMVRVHRATGHARVNVEGKEHWLGRAGSLTARQRYREIVNGWMDANPGARAEAGEAMKASICAGLVVDFGHCVTEITEMFEGHGLGVLLRPDGSGFMLPSECRRLAEFLIEAAEWLESRDNGPGLPDGTVVYAISDGHAHHKIGKAVNIRKRLKQLQTGNGRKLRLVAYLRCENESLAYQAESAAKRSIADCRSVGEWFECDSHTAIHALHEAQQLVGIVNPPVEMQPEDDCVPEMPGGPTDGR